MPWVYILKTRKNTYYVGSTNNLGNRIVQHQKGRVTSTKDRLPIKLVFKEHYNTTSEARVKENKIKKWKSRKMIEILIKHGPVV